MSETLVIGGSGFVGGETVATFRRAGERVVAIHYRQPASDLTGIELTAVRAAVSSRV